MRRLRARLAVVILGLLALTAGLLHPAFAVGPTFPPLSPVTLTNPLPAATRLPNGWALSPAGTQVLTSRAPTGVTVTPDGQTVYAVTSGIFEESLDRADTTTLLPTKTLVGDAYQGVAADGSGDVWVSGGPANAVFQYKAVGPVMVDVRQAGPAPALPNRGIPVTGYPGNMLLSGSRLFVAGNLSVPNSVVQGVTGSTAGCANSTICSVVSVIDVSNPLALAPAVHAIAVGRDAYGLAYRPATQTLYVSNWADQTNSARAAGMGTVSVVKVNADGSGSEVQVVPVGPAATGVALSSDGTTLAVANSDNDTISLLPIGADGSVTMAGIRTVSVGLPGSPPGTTPLALTYSTDGKYLYVALAGIDAVEVLDGRGNPIPQQVAVSYAGHPVSVRAPATYIPTGWYPDALAVAPAPKGSGTRLYVANLKGQGAGPGYYGQLQPLVGTSTEGTLSAVDLATDPSASFNTWTAQVVQGSQLAPVFAPSLADPASNACIGPDGKPRNDILCGQQASTPKLDPKTLHVVVILAENKTFDSYFGDIGLALPTANALPAFTEYGAAVTPNQHLLAQSFSLSDNFWNEGAEVSGLGHSWITGGYATPDNELTWGQTNDQGLRGGRNNGQYSGSLTGLTDPNVAAQENTMLNPRLRLADEVASMGLSTRVYGTDFNPGSPSAANVAPQGLWGVGPKGPPPQSPVTRDLAFPDIDRANIFLHGQTTSHAWDLLEGAPPPTFLQPMAYSAADKAKFTLDGWSAAYNACPKPSGNDSACQQAMPNFTYMTLPENHTYVLSNVFNPLDPTPQSMAADNDYAIGQIVQGLSQSPFWKNTIVFVSEDDNQFTGDHVDIHRTFLLTAGGLASQLGRAGQVSSEVGSFPSVPKTVEVLLGLPPLTLFDQRAVPLHDMVASSAPASAPAFTAVVPLTPFLANTPLPPQLPPLPVLPPIL
jgi:DNA-binding beta-propeller fold protein YncE